jgi:hypothetical protein
MKKFLTIYFSFLFFSTAYCQNNDLILSWQRAYGGERNEIAYAGVETTDGGFMIVGSTNSKNSFDVKESRGFDANGGNDFWVIKTNASGAIEWSKTFGGTKDDIATSIAKTLNNEYVIIGTTQSTDGDANLNGVNGGLLMIRLKQNGDLVSKRLFAGGNNVAGASFESANSYSKPTIKVLPDGRLAVGATRSVGVSPFSGLNFYLALLTPFGDTLWERSFGGGLQDYLSDFVVASDGTFMLVGSTLSLARDIPGAGQGFLDFLIIKVDAFGREVWKRGYGGSSFDVLNAVVEIGTTRNFLMVGETSSNDGVPGNGLGDKDGIVLKMDTQGNLIAQRRFGGSDNDGFYHIVSGLNDDFYAVGTSESQIGNVRPKGTRTDVWFMAFNENNLNAKYHRLYGGADIDIARHAFINSKKEVILSSSSRSADTDLTINRGQSDFWLINLAPPPPIVFGRFEANLNENEEIEVLWTTLFEQNSQFIQLEKSANGIDYFQINESFAAINSAQTKTYRFMDKNPILGRNHYQLKYTDNTGKIYVGPRTSFNFLPLSAEPTQNHVFLYPNPSSDFVNIISSDKFTKISMVNIRGIKQNILIQEPYADTYRIDFLDKPQSGLYFIILENSISRSTHKIVVR